MMAKFIIVMSVLISLALGSSVMSINEKCDDNIFILISSKTVFLYSFDSQNDNSPSVIYQTKPNNIIANGLFNKRTNTIILLIINQLNGTYSIVSLNAYNDIYNNWKEKSNNLVYSSYIYLSLGQHYFYVLNSQTMLLQIFALPLRSTPYKQNYLLNFPKNQTILNYIIDEKFDSLWILFKNIQYQLYICGLKTFSCRLYMNIFNVDKSIQSYINWNYQQFYLYSRNYLMIFEYNRNQTVYSIYHLNSTQQNQDQFFTICEKTNYIEYITINYTNQRQVCYQTCQHLPLILNDTSHIHTIQRLSTLSDILYCSKQRQISKIIMIILILVDIAIILGVIVWLAYKYFHRSTLDKHEKQTNSGTIWSIENDFVTHF